MTSDKQGGLRTFKKGQELPVVTLELVNQWFLTSAKKKIFKQTKTNKWVCKSVGKKCTVSKHHDLVSCLFQEDPRDWWDSPMFASSLLVLPRLDCVAQPLLLLGGWGWGWTKRSSGERKVSGRDMVHTYHLWYPLSPCLPVDWRRLWGFKRGQDHKMEGIWVPAWFYGPYLIKLWCKEETNHYCIMPLRFLRPL